MRKDIRSAVVAIVVMTIVLGLLYPLAITGIGQVAFPNAADGSTVKVDGKVVGSKLIGQDFSTGKNANRYFQSRPSVTGYAPNATFFNNRGPNQATLAVQQRRFVLDYLQREQPYVPEPEGVRRALRCGDDVRLGRRPADLPRERAHPGRTRREGARPPDRSGARAHRREHRRPVRRRAR